MNNACPKCDSGNLTANTDGMIVYFSDQSGVFNLSRVYPHEKVFYITCLKCNHSWEQQAEL